VVILNIKQVLNDYVDACELVRETEEDIEALQNEESMMTSDKVKGSMKEYPYIGKNFNIKGADRRQVEHLRRKRLILNERKEKAEETKLQALEIINTAPPRIQRIIRYRYMEKLTWKEVAEKMDIRTTEKSVQKEFERFLKNF
jgi:DNA-directed RNA polymerase specialized sigma24 family protein